MSTTPQSAKEKKTQKPPPDIPIHMKLFKDGTLVESIYLNDIPTLLVREPSGKILTTRSFAHHGDVYVPPAAGPTPYPKYEFTNSDDLDKYPTTQQLFDKLCRYWKEFVETKEEYRKLNANYTLMTYKYERSLSLPYLGFFGDNSTGKGQRCTLHWQLDYRPMYTVDPTAPNIYQFISEVHGSVIIDESYLEGKPELLTILKTGYKRGATVSRIITSSNKGIRLRVDYDIYSPKILSGERIPSNKGLKERLISELTRYGEPKKDEFTEADLKAFETMRKYLLLWKVHTYFTPVSPVVLPFKARSKELYRPLIEVTDGSPFQEGILKILQKFQKQSATEMKNSLECTITKALIWTYESGCYVDEIRSKIAEYLDGELHYDRAEPPRPIGVDCNLFKGYITDRMIFKQIQLLVSGEIKRVTSPTEGQVRSWVIDKEALIQSGKKYQLGDDADVKDRFAKLLAENGQV